MPKTLWFPKPEKGYAKLCNFESYHQSQTTMKNKMTTRCVWVEAKK